MDENPVNSVAGKTRVPAVVGRPKGRVGDPRLIHLAKLAVEWKAELEGCGEECGVESVHRIRTGTRRLEAMIDLFTTEAAAGNPLLEKAADRWRRQLKRIRRAAAPVRDLDVHRELLEKFVGTATGGSPATPHELDIVEEQSGSSPSPDSTLAQADKLAVWLKHAREHHAAQLRKQISKRIGKLDELAAAFSLAWIAARGRRKVSRDAALAGLDVFAGLSEGIAALDENNLHDFRKGAKKARYVTEAGGENAQAKAVGQAIKRVQDVIGDWHDRQCLAEEARTALAGDGAELSAMLGGEVERSLQQAKRVAERMRGRLVGEWRARRGRRA